jgi:hypothetical protein
MRGERTCSIISSLTNWEDMNIGTSWNEADRMREEADREYMKVRQLSRKHIELGKNYYKERI